MNSSHAEIDRLMAESDDMIAYGATLGIDPSDDSEESQRRLAIAWERHCAQAARNERGSLLADEVFIDNEEIEDSEALAIFNFVQDIVLRLKDEESKETLIRSILLLGLQHVSGPLADRIANWIEEGK